MVGLTGGIASGKSTVSHILESEHHIPLLDLDKVAREVVQRGEPTLARLVAHFGPSILDEQGNLNRPVLAKAAFSSPEGRRALNRLTHGAIRRRTLWSLVRLWLAGAKVVVVDTPLLVESGLWRLCGQAVLVHVPPEVQRARLLARDAKQGKRGAEAEQDAENRLASQLPLDAKRVYADVVLDNAQEAEASAASAGPEEGEQQAMASPALRRQVDELVGGWATYDRGAGWVRWAAAWLLPPVGVGLALLAVGRRSLAVAWRRREQQKEAKGQ